MACVGWRTDGFEFTTEITNANTDGDPSSRQLVHRRQLPSQLNRLSERRHQNISAETNSARGPDSDKTACQSVEPVDRVNVPDVCRYSHAVAEPGTVVPELFGSLDEIAHRDRIPEWSLTRHHGSKAQAAVLLAHGSTDIDGVGSCRHTLEQLASIGRAAVVENNRILTMTPQ